MREREEKKLGRLEKDERKGLEYKMGRKRVRRRPTGEGTSVESRERESRKREKQKRERTR